jgi:universal stress protein A
MRILISSIGSKRSRATLAFGVEVARALSADTLLLGVVGRRDNAEKLWTALHDAADRLGAGGLEATVRVEPGSAEKVLMAELQQTAYDLVALGALGGKRSRRALLGSVAERIIEKAQSSVLVIKGKRTSLSRVLICTSGTEHGHPVVQIGAALACGAGAKATLLHVVDPMPGMYAGLEQMEETLDELLQAPTDMAGALRWDAQALRKDCEISEIKLRRGMADDEIIREGQQGDHDLIVLGSSMGAGGLVRALMGDLTRAVVARAQRPVLVVRPPG